MDDLRLSAVPAFADNYVWLLADSAGDALVVDPGDAGPVRAALARDILRLRAILLTHHHADHIGDHWVIRTNADGATNFKLVTAPDGSHSRKDWVDLVPHRADVFVQDFDLFDGFVAIEERSGGLERIRLRKNDGSDQFVQADEPAYSMALDDNSEHDTPWLRYGYTSLATPDTIWLPRWLMVAKPM